MSMTVTHIIIMSNVYVNQLNVIKLLSDSMGP